MDFGRFTNKIKASAEAAAVAARSFKGFDDMAAQDEYIHSEFDSLNVNVNVNQKSQQSRDDSQHEADSDHSHSASHDLSSSGRSWSLLDRPRPDSTPKNEEGTGSHIAGVSRPWTSPKSTPELGTSTSAHSLPETRQQETPPTHHHHHHQAPLRQSTMPLLAVVADTFNNNNKSSVTKEKQTKDESSSGDGSSSQDDFSDEDDENDPILSLIRKTPPPSISLSSKTTKSQNQSTLTLTSSRRKEQKLQKQMPVKKQQMQFLEMEDESPVRTQQKKNPNRFMQDLDQRMAMPELYTDDVEKAGLLSSEAPDNRTLEQPSSVWLWDVLKGGSRQQQQQQDSNTAATQERKAAPLSRQDRRTQEPPKPVQENFYVVGSSSVLGEDEIRALAQLKESSRPTGLVSSCLGLVRRHPRESFILFTLILGWVVYFYSRKISAEDDVT
jgi:hypothetical protein